MESLNIEEINFLTKPNINNDKFKIITNPKDVNVYANLYEINITKELKLYQYPYTVSPEIDKTDMEIRRKLFRACRKEVRKIYEECFVSGDSLYTTIKVDDIKIVKCHLYSTLNGRIEYTLTFDKFAKEKKIEHEDIHKDPLTKQFIELIIKDILHSNPKLEFYKGLFVLTNKKKNLKTDRVNIDFYPGFTTSFMETDKGNYLNVTLKNKIIQGENLLQFINRCRTNHMTNDDIREELTGRSFKVSYAKRNYRIDDILFDRNPQNTTFLYDGNNINLVNYYDIAHRKKIQNLNQPLILVRKPNSEGEMVNLYFIPELCSLAGLDDESTRDGQFMKQLAQYTKLEPSDRVQLTDQFLELLWDEDVDEKKDKSKSAKEKSDYYGIEIKPLNELYKAYYMQETKLISEDRTRVTPKDRTFPVLEKKNMNNWLCFYEKNNYNDADSLYFNLKKASKAFGLKVTDPEWVEMRNRASAKEWTNKAEEYLNDKRYKYDFVVFLLDKNERIYPELKRHSLCKNGYVSQVVKVRSIRSKGVMSVCSKILLQINAKLRGISYIADKIENGFMVIGVSSSHIKGKRTGVAMVATINNTYTDFYNQEDIIHEEKKEQLQYCVSSFIEKAIQAYNKENNNNPKGIIIYRQGVSLQQKEYLKVEIGQIENTCKTKNVPFYYILVNTKTTFKFFEKNGNQYKNPGSGLLVIEGVTNRNYFEFYIQPQQVTQGSATPTCFHVAYGNLNMPEMIPKFTFDLCHIYSNWQGTIRIPNVIKAAEKLSKMTAKYKLDELNPNLKYGQAYL